MATLQAPTLPAISTTVPAPKADQSKPDLMKVLEKAGRADTQVMTREKRSRRSGTSSKYSYWYLSVFMARLNAAWLGSGQAWPHFSRAWIWWKATFQVSSASQELYALSNGCNRSLEDAVCATWPG